MAEIFNLIERYEKLKEYYEKTILTTNWNGVNYWIHDIPLVFTDSIDIRINEAEGHTATVQMIKEWAAAEITYVGEDEVNIIVLTATTPPPIDINIVIEVTHHE